MMSNNTNRMTTILPRNQSNLLYCISFVGFVTGTIGCFNGKHGLGTIVYIAASLGVNYWRKPVYGWRRTLDMTWLQIGILIHCYYAWFTRIRYIYYFIQVNGVLYYGLSWYFYNKNAMWRSTLCHSVVHLCANTSLLLLYSNAIYM